MSRASLILNELAQSLLQKLADESGKPLEEIKKMHDSIEKELKKTIDPLKDSQKFFGVLTNVLKSKLGLPGAKGGRTV